jgi:peptide/nickel transport system permease protein
MARLLVRRFAGAIITMFIISSLVFLITDVIPGSPAAIILGVDSTPEQVAALNTEMGLDQPVLVRYANWLGDLLTGNLGTSYYNKSSVAVVLSQRLEPTLVLTFTSSMLVVLIGIPLGIVAAVYRGSGLDYASMVTALIGAAMPSFWLGLLLILLFALHWQFFPSSGYLSFMENPGEAWRYIALPAITLGVSHAGVVARMARANLLEVLNADYLRTARSKGVRERTVILGHALRNSLIPTLGVVGVAVTLMVGGSIVVESIFAIPGIGRLLIESVVRRDFPMIQGVILLIALLVALVNLAVDILYALLDPRIRHD